MLGLNTVLTHVMEKRCMQTLCPAGAVGGICVCSHAPASRGHAQLELVGALSPMHVEGDGRMPDRGTGTNWGRQGRRWIQCCAGGVGWWDVRTRFRCCWLSEGLLRDPALGQGGHLNRVIEVHPLINIVEVRGGAGQGPSAASREDDECLQGDKQRFP